jgi:xylulokinase
MATRALDTSRIAGVGVSGLFPAFVALDAQGQPIDQASLYGDHRASAYLAETEGRLGVTLTGDEVSPRLLWFREALPESYARTERFVGPTGFVVRMLTGRTTIDPHSAYRWGGLVDVTRTAWASTAVERLGIPICLLPEIVASHDVVGSVTRDAALRSGLKVGTPVIGGTTDSLATLVGSGAVHARDVMIYFGSSWTVMAVTAELEDVLRDPSQIDRHRPWQLATYAVDSGLFVDAVRKQMLGGRSPRTLDREAATVPPGARGMAVIPLPSRRFDGDGLVPSRASIVGFGIERGRADIWRASLESLGYLVADGLERLGPTVRRCVAAGGGARSDVWRQIVADITGLELRHGSRSSAALGAAFLAAFGLGAVASLDPAAEGWLANQDATFNRPDPIASATYALERLAWLKYERALTGT